MDNETYEETRLKKDETWSKYMKEGTEAALLFWNGKVISVDPPVSMELEVTDTDPGLKGNTAAGSALHLHYTTMAHHNINSESAVLGHDACCSDVMECLVC
jgi:hypothetical protein